MKTPFALLLIAIALGAETASAVPTRGGGDEQVLDSSSPQYLAPENDINLPPSKTASSPLTWLGANGPWFAGDNLYDISNSVPEGCKVDMASYNLRHGSRYPDNGAYGEWVALYEKIQNATSFAPSGPLFFLKTWSPVLTHPSSQISHESPTGTKEAHDLGYTLRTRYAQLYPDPANAAGNLTNTTADLFHVWSNNYPRVLETASAFLEGYLGPEATSRGRVVSVSSKAPFSEAIGNSLGPSDQCPLFNDTGGREQQATWLSVFLPAVKTRLSQYLGEDTDFVLEDRDLTIMPYLCGYESQITGLLSPWCDVWNDDELRSYEYLNDLRYFYGMGVGTGLERTMMTPFLRSLVTLLANGPGQLGIAATDGVFEVPDLIMAFMNDGQLNELAAASGVFDEQGLLDPDVRDDERVFMARRLGVQRGTVAFERLVCSPSSDSSSSDDGHGHGYGGHGSGRGKGGRPKRAEEGEAEEEEEEEDIFIRILLNDAVYPVPSCQSGPGRSCPLGEYVAYVEKRVEREGDWMVNCNVTDPGASGEAQGARFFTDLRGDYLEVVEP